MHDFVQYVVGGLGFGGIYALAALGLVLIFKSPTPPLKRALGFSKVNEEGPVAIMSPGARSTEYTVPLAFSSRMLTVVVEGSLTGLGAALIRPPNLNRSGRGSGEKRISAGSEHMTNLQSKVHTV